MQILDKEFCLSINIAFRRKPALEAIVCRQRSDLKQDSVLKFDGLVKCPPVGQITCDKRRPDDKDGKAREEAAAQ
ncbi:hypothetical protein GCM10022626_07030 [[Pseudomonas] carboxydohydrogena]